MPSPSPGFCCVLRRELRWLARRPLELFLQVGLPLLCLAVVWAVFSRGVATDLPVAVLDEDRSAASRQFIRLLDAMPGIAVRQRVTSLAEGWSLLRRGDVYACVQVPRDFSKHLKLARGAEANAWFNAEFLSAANVVQRDLATAATAFGAMVEARGQLARGATRPAVAVQVQPVSAQRGSLFNPGINYVPSIVAGLVPALVHMAVMLAMVRAIGRELRDRSAGRWLRLAGGRIVPAVLAKMIPVTLAGTGTGWLALAFVHGVLGWPMRGSWWLLDGGFLALILAYQAIALLVLAFAPNFRLASSITAFITAPAFAFGGLTFPLMAMEPFAFVWARLLPLTTFLHLQVEQTMRGAAL